MRTAGKIATTAAAAGLLLASTLAVPLAAQSAEFDPATLDAFVTASLRVQEVRQDYEGRLSQAGSQDEQRQIVEQANAAMVSAVEETPGIGVEEYIAVGEAAAQDADLNARIGEIARQRAE